MRRWDILERDDDSSRPTQRVIPGTVLCMTTDAAAAGRGLVAAGTDYGTVHLLDLESGAAKYEFELSDCVDAVAFGQLRGRAAVAAGKYGGVIQAWDLTTRSPYPPLANQSARWGLLDIREVGGRLLVASVDEDNRFRLRDIETSEEIGPPI